MRRSDGLWCCSERTSALGVSLICLLYSCMEKQLACTEPRCGLQLEVNSFRSFIHTLFQVANIMSLLGATIESPTLLKFSLWYMLAFVLMALVISMLEFVMRLVLDGSLTVMEFVSEVALFFVMFQCLPIVDSFQRSLE